MTVGSDAYCTEVIGTYERLHTVAPGPERTTSLAAKPRLAAGNCSTE
jgi:hypothetical protein